MRHYPITYAKWLSECTTILYKGHRRQTAVSHRVTDVRLLTESQTHRRQFAGRYFSVVMDPISLCRYGARGEARGIPGRPPDASISNTNTTSLHGVWRKQGAGEGYQTPAGAAETGGEVRLQPALTGSGNIPTADAVRALCKGSCHARRGGREPSGH